MRIWQRVLKLVYSQSIKKMIPIERLALRLCVCSCIVQSLACVMHFERKCGLIWLNFVASYFNCMKVCFSHIFNATLCDIEIPIKFNMLSFFHILLRQNAWNCWKIVHECFSQRFKTSVNRFIATFGVNVDSTKLSSDQISSQTITLPISKWFSRRLHGYNHIANNSA